MAHVNMVVSAFSSEAFISNADAVLAAEDARAAAENSQCAAAQALTHGFLHVMPKGPPPPLSLNYGTSKHDLGRTNHAAVRALHERRRRAFCVLCAGSGRGSTCDT